MKTWQGDQQGRAETLDLSGGNPQHSSHGSMNPAFRWMFVLGLALMLIPGLSFGAGTPPPPPQDDPTTSTNCWASAEIVFSNIVINPNQPTNDSYDCVVCVGDNINASLQWFQLPSTNVLQTCHTYNGSYYTNWCDPPVYVTGDWPINITNGWWLNPVPPDGNDWTQTNGIGTSIPAFSYTNGTSGWLGFYNLSASMPTNSYCGVWSHWDANETRGWRSFAAVEVASMAPDMGVLVATNPNTYAICVVPPNAAITNLTVTAVPNPWLMDKYLPAGWQMTGGLATTNADPNDVLISRTKRLVDLTTPGITTVTCVSGCSSNTVIIYVIKAEIESLEFTSDHHVMTDNNTNWSDSGGLYVKPDWVPDVRTNPISQTKDTAVSVDMVVNVQPSGVPFKLKASCNATNLAFPDNLSTSTGGSQTLSATSTNNLPNCVGVLSDSISWTITAFDDALACAETNSGPHKIYVTFGTPENSTNNMPTEKRISWVCNTCAGRTTQHGCVTNIHDSAGKYDVQRSNSPNPIWEIAGGAHGLCNELSTFYAAATHTVGIPGGEVIFVYPKPGKTVKETGSSGDNETRLVAFSSPLHPSNTTHDDENLEEAFIFKDKQGDGNAFEACFKFTADGLTRYYAGGAGIYETAQDVMVDVCAFTVWLFGGVNPITGDPIPYQCDNPGPVESWP